MSKLSDNEKAPLTHQPNYWLIVAHETSKTDILTVDLDGEESLSGGPKGASSLTERHPVLKEAV